MRALLRDPLRVAGQVGGLARSTAETLVAGARPAPVAPWNRGVTGSDRRFTWVRGDLARVKAVKNELGGTVNDVMLSVVAGALRRELERRGESTAGVELKAFVPVSVRSDEQSGSLGNQVTGMITRLPVGTADPAECLAEVSGADAVGQGQRPGGGSAGVDGARARASRRGTF